MTNHTDSSETFNIKEFIIQALSYKYIYIISFLTCITIAFIVNKFSPVIYQANSTLGPVENIRSALLLSNDRFSGLEAFEQSRNIENDINSLQSFTLVSSTIAKLNLEVGYFAETNQLLRKIHQFYPNSSYKVNIDKSHLQPVYTKFYINILDNNSFRLRASGDQVGLYNYLDNLVVSRNENLRIDTICRFNETITNQYFKFSLSLNEEFNPSSEKDHNLNYFQFFHLDNLARNYLGSLSVEPANLKSSLLNVRFKGQNLALTIDFLNNYLQNYLDDNLAKKNKIALNTINFIDSQISQISDSLLVSESNLRDYRSTYQVTDLSFQGKQALEQMTQIENERSNLQVQERYYNYILDYFEKNQDMTGLAPPSSANVVDPIMNSLVLDLLSLNNEKSTILNNNAEKNLFLGQLENRIRLQQQTIIENVKNNLNTLNLTQNELNYRAEKVSREISKLPRTELNMVSMQRKFNLTDAIYTFLLQKRSEAAITMASNYPDYEILEPGREITSFIISPRTMINWLLALFISIVIPTAFIILKGFFNEKIVNVKDVESLLKRSVIGLIYTNYHKTEAVVLELPGSPIAESFRNLRSNLFLKFRSEPIKVILVTSSQSQDGKSFISYNLAASVASVGHNTVILDGDLRRPTLHNKYKNENSKGLSNYMTNHTPLDEIIFRTNIDNLSFIPAGPVIPNCSELVEAGALDELMISLKDKYDYIIIDTTPTGLVADASLLIKYASHILLVCRNNYTRKDDFNNVLDMFITNNIQNFDVVFNDMNLKKSRIRMYKAYNKKG